MTITWLAGFNVVAMFLASTLPVIVKTNTGETISGQLGAIGATSVHMVAAGQDRELMIDDLQSIEPVELSPQTGPTSQVLMTSGSRIAAQEVQVTDGATIIEPRRQQVLRIPVKEVKAIRFRGGSATTDAQWLGLLQQESRGDVLVIRRPGDKLDPATGIVESIGAGKVNFNLEGDLVAAPIDRLEGIIFGGTGSIADDAPITVLDVYGSKWSVLSLAETAENQPLKMKLSSGQEHELPLEQLAGIRFRSGMMLLAGQQPASSSTSTFVGVNVQAGLIDAFFGPAAIVDAGSPSSGSPSDDLQLQGGTKVEYRIDDGFQNLSGAVQRVTQIPRAGKVTVRIRLDGKVVFEESLSDAQPRGFEIDTVDARRLAIEVDDNGDGNLGDRVRIIRPRLLK